MKILLSTGLGIFIGGWLLMMVTVLTDDYIEYMKEKKRDEEAMKGPEEIAEKYHEPDYCDGNIGTRKDRELTDNE